MMSTSGWVWTKSRVSFLSVSRRFSRASTASAKRESRSSDWAMRVQFEQCPQKSGMPSVVGRSRQFRVRASMRASVYFPDPCAPERMTACGKRLRATISRRRWMVSGFPTKSENGIKTLSAVSSWLLAKSQKLRAESSSSDLQLLPHQLHDNRMRFVGCASGVDHVHSLWLAGCDRQIRMADASKKGPAFLLEAVLVFFRALFRSAAFVFAIATPRALDGEGHLVI